MTRDAKFGERGDARRETDRDDEPGEACTDEPIGEATEEDSTTGDPPRSTPCEYAAQAAPNV